MLAGKLPKLYFPVFKGENSKAAENTPSFQEFGDQLFDEKQIPDATHTQKSALQSENQKK